MNILAKNYLFLIGGADLEMQSIKQLLKENHYDYIDNDLSWGAKLSDYKSEIEANKDKILVGIELLEDIYLPENYIRIDHHNELSDNASSIEQVAELLGIKLTRRQLLIAANDVGHIAAMRNFGASQDEIDEIRLADRACQGVSESEEIIAEDDVKNIIVQNGVSIVKTTIEHFSAITDRIEAEKLLIYNEQKLCYYGTGANSIIKDKFINLINEGKAYYGGKGDGFFGIANNVLSGKELEQIVDSIIVS